MPSLMKTDFFSRCGKMSEDEHDPRNIPLSVKVFGVMLFPVILPILLYIAIKPSILRLDQLPDGSIGDYFA